MPHPSPFTKSSKPPNKGSFKPGNQAAKKTNLKFPMPNWEMLETLAHGVDVENLFLTAMTMNDEELQMRAVREAGHFSPAVVARCEQIVATAQLARQTIQATLHAIAANLPPVPQDEHRTRLLELLRNLEQQNDSIERRRRSRAKAVDRSLSKTQPQSENPTMKKKPTQKTKTTSRRRRKKHPKKKTAKSKASPKKKKTSTHDPDNLPHQPRFEPIR